MNQQTTLPVAYSFFCDDFRQEVGNKVSYMGVYQGVMLVREFPLKLSKLCAAATVRFQRNQAPPGVVFRLFNREAVIATRLLDLGSLSNKQTNELDMDTVFATVLFQLAPFSLEEPTLLTSRVSFNDHELNAGELVIRSQPNTASP